MQINKRMLKWLFFTLIVLVPWASNGFAGPFDEIVAFGDSLSDNGNLVFVENQPLPDSALYFEGRFSNGRIWVEYLADPERLDAPLTNRALGGAQSDGLVPPGLIEQVATHIATDGFQLSSSTLFIIWIGGNDYFNADSDFPPVVANIKDAMERLVEFGARRILVMNLPDLGTIPDTLGTPEAAEATAFSTGFNTALGNMLDTFSTEYPEVDLYEFDVFAFFVMIQSDPGAFGFSNVTDPSPNFQVENNFDGAGHVFWDDKHPTTQTHALLADQVFTSLSEQIPPPGTNNEVQNEDNSSTCFINSLNW